jgi:hypothetical protein
MRCQFEGGDHEASLRGARYNARTKWPAGFDPIAHGAVPAQ